MRRLFLSLALNGTLAFAQPEAPAQPPLVAVQPPAPTALESMRGRLGIGYFGTDFIPVLVGQPTGAAPTVHLTPLLGRSGFSSFLAAPRVGFRRWSTVSVGPVQSVGVELTVGTSVSVSRDQQTDVASFETRETVGDSTYTMTNRQQSALSGWSGGGVSTSLGLPLALLSTTHVIAWVAPRATLRFGSGNIVPKLGADAPSALSTAWAVGFGVSAGVEVLLTAIGLPNWSVEGSLALSASWTSLRLATGSNVIASQTFRLETSFDGSPMDGVLSGLGLKYYF